MRAETMSGFRGTCTPTDDIWLTVFGMFFILLITLVYTRGEHKLSQMVKHSKCVFYSFLGNIGYIFYFCFLNKPPPWTNTTITMCQISTLLIKSLSGDLLKQVQLCFQTLSWSCSLPSAQRWEEVGSTTPNFLSL